MFLDKILVPDPHKRMTIEQMEKDPWFAVYVFLSGSNYVGLGFHPYPLSSGYQPETIVATAEPSHDEAAIGQV